MNVEHLPLTEHLSPDRSGHRLLVVGTDVGQDGMPVLGGSSDLTDLTDTGECHLQRPRNWSRGECEHVNRSTQCLQFVLGRDTETLLLVDNEET